MTTENESSKEKKKLKKKLKKEKKKLLKKEKKRAKKREARKERKRRRKEQEEVEEDTRTEKRARIDVVEKEKEEDDTLSATRTTSSRRSSHHEKHYKIVESSALDDSEEANGSSSSNNNNTPKDNSGTTSSDDVTLLLFYQYVDPPWDTADYKSALKRMEQLGSNLTGRMRVAREGLNCTLTGTYEAILKFCLALRSYSPRGEFAETEFKLTTDLPKAQLFPSLKVMPVTELVHYGLAGAKAPPMEYTGQHLDPVAYHKKLAEENTVVIDVRNHYEAAIGRFAPPATGATLLDPLMRKSTEFPMWLDSKETKEKLKGKQVLMYCTGGVRCERASSLLKYKMEKDPEVAALGIRGVYQLQGGIDKYFKEFPQGGFWKGKNYTFDKRFAHTPTAAAEKEQQEEQQQEEHHVPLGKCEACQKPWDMYRGKRRCPTCGVPSLICRDCMSKVENGMGGTIRCDLCVRQGITKKSQIRQQEHEAEQRYEERMEQKGMTTLRPTDETQAAGAAPNPDKITRLKLKNMCNKYMTEEVLLETLPGITHIVWKTLNRNGGDRQPHFFGQGWVEMESPEAAARAVQQSGKLKPLGRKLFIDYEAPDPKDRWPPPNSRVY